MKSAPLMSKRVFSNFVSEQTINVDLPRFQRARLNEILAGIHLVACQEDEHPVGGDHDEQRVSRLPWGAVERAEALEVGVAIADYQGKSHLPEEAVQLTGRQWSLAPKPSHKQTAVPAFAV